MENLKQIAAGEVAKGTKISTLKNAKSNEIQDFFKRFSGQIAQALPKHLTPERMIAMATHAVTSNPKLAECKLSSLVGAIMQASILGFQPVAALGECYLVPYGDVVQFQIGYKGLIRLAQRSGKLVDIYAEIVRENDLFSMELGLHRKLIHIPANERGKMIKVYAVAHYNSGGYSFVVLDLHEIEALRKRNLSQKNEVVGAWATDYEAMAKAKAIKQLAKYLPLSVEIINAVATDESVINVESFEQGIIHPESIDYITGEIDEVINDG